MYAPTAPHVLVKLPLVIPPMEQSTFCNLLPLSMIFPKSTRAKVCESLPEAFP
jgi:hypothetical protein